MYEKNVFLIIIIFCIGILSGCGKDNVLQLTKEKVQSITVNTYDFDNNQTTMNLVYKKNQMEDILNYLTGLSGVKMESFNAKDIGYLLFGIDLYAGNPNTHVLFAENYVITDKGEYYFIDKEEAEKIYKSVTGNNTRVTDLFIYNHRYLSLINGKWDTKYMIKSKWTKNQLANIQMKCDKTIVNNEDENLELEIINNSSSKISFGFQIEIEAMVDDVWYNIDDMINGNIELGWTLELFNINSGESFNDNFVSLKYYQPLPEGKYRLIKEISNNVNNGYIAYEFDVN